MRNNIYLWIGKHHYMKNLSEYPCLCVAFGPGSDVPSKQNKGIPSFKRKNIMKEIPITQGYFAQVDDEDYESMMKWKWQIVNRTNTNYAKCGVCRPRIHLITTYRMHRMILGITDPKIQIDHKDGNGLNNQKSNLRVCSISQNGQNCSSHVGSKSKYVGVNISNKNRKNPWISRVQVNGIRVFLGLFETEYEAALFRDHFILDNKLEFPRLNILTRP